MHNGYVMAQGPTHPEPVLHLFGQTLQQYRKQRKLSQRALAAIIHVTPTYISDVERGKRNVSLLLLLRLAVALQIPLVDILQPLVERPELFMPLQEESPTATHSTIVE